MTIVVLSGLRVNTQKSIPSKLEALVQCWLMLAHRLQRWPNINQPLGQRLVFAGLLTTDIQYTARSYASLKPNKLITD